MLNGEVYHSWTIIDCSILSRVEVRCKCGSKKILRSYDIGKGSPSQCRECYDRERIKKGLIPIGTIFGDWIVISEDYIHKNSKTGGLKQKVKCVCGYECFLELSPLKAGRTKSCQKCSSNKRKKLYKAIPLLYIKRIEQGAIKRNFTFEISNEYIWSLFCKQEGKCALSGVEISFENKTASLDRIDSKIGYKEGNVQWLHKVVNQMKSNRTDEEFIDWCKKITNQSNNGSTR